MLALLEANAGSWRSITADAVALGSAEAVAQARGLTQGDLFGADSGFESAVDQWQLRLTAMSDQGVRCIPVTSENYPAAVREVPTRPPFIFIRGILDERDHDGVAIIGSRVVPESSLRTAREWSRDLASKGIPVVSGLAAGIDRQAHLGALDVGARTVAVIGTGIDRAYPSEHRQLQDSIAESGLVVSQFFPGSPPTKKSFPMRNGLMAAWSRATLVIDAADRSGASLQARLATEIGRTLLIHAQLESEQWARTFVERGAATFVSSPDEVARAL